MKMAGCSDTYYVYVKSEISPTKTTKLSFLFFFFKRQNIREGPVLALYVNPNLQHSLHHWANTVTELESYKRYDWSWRKVNNKVFMKWHPETPRVLEALPGGGVSNKKGGLVCKQQWNVHSSSRAKNNFRVPALKSSHFPRFLSTTFNFEANALIIPQR